MLQQLKAARILEEERRWRFTHDTFEEYFAASRVVSTFRESENESEYWPEFDPWVDSHATEKAFLEVLEFVREMTTVETARGPVIGQRDQPGDRVRPLGQASGRHDRPYPSSPSRGTWHSP